MIIVYLMIFESNVCQRFTSFVQQAIITHLPPAAMSKMLRIIAVE